MAGIESKPTSTGVSLLSSYTRAFFHRVILQVQPPGLSTIVSNSPVMLVPPLPAIPAGEVWPVSRNLVYRFSGNMLLQSASPGVVSLESAGLSILLGTLANPLAFGGTTGFTQVNAARLSAQSALLENSPISFDEWEIDCNDLLSQFPLAAALQLTAFATINDTGVAPKQVRGFINFRAAAAQFTGYRFDKWE